METIVAIATSHRARNRLIGALSSKGVKNPESVYSFQIGTLYGAYRVPKQMAECVRGVKGCRVSRIPADDWLKCW